MDAPCMTIWDSDAKAVKTVPLTRVTQQKDALNNVHEFAVNWRDWEVGKRCPRVLIGASETERDVTGLSYGDGQCDWNHNDTGKGGVSKAGYDRCQHGAHYIGDEGLVYCGVHYNHLVNRHHRPIGG